MESQTPLMNGIVVCWCHSSKEDRESGRRTASCCSRLSPDLKNRIATPPRTTGDSLAAPGGVWLPDSNIGGCTASTPQVVINGRGIRATIHAVVRLSLLLPVTASVFILLACGNGGTESDRVVNIERECRVFGKGEWKEFPASFCASLFGDPESGDESYFRQDSVPYRREASLKLTIRTTAGTTYSISVPTGTSLELGQRWPTGGHQ